VSHSITGAGTLPLTRDSFAGLTPERRFLGRNLSKADVSVYSVGGRRIAVKDYAARPLFVRHTLGRLLIGRECRAYQRAGTLPGIAPFLGRLGPFTMATGWVDARPLSELPGGSVSLEIFDRLDAVIQGLHANGIAISDLHHRDVLVGVGGAVHVVDFAASHVLGPRPNGFSRRMFNRLSTQDRLAAARMRARFTGRPEDEALAGVDPTAVRLWGAGRRIKGVWDWLRLRRD
jgi:hypothetical protein